MGLALEVGVLAASSADADAEGQAYHAAALERLNSYLTSRQLPAHSEPVNCEPWSGEMIGYSGLHDLRRLAAYLDSESPLPAPAREDSAKDPCLVGYYAAVDGQQPGLLRRLFGRQVRYRRSFDHLIVHGDAEGYYLPTDFPDVLFPPPSLEIPGGMVGSAPRLLAELERIAQALGIPDNLTPDADELWEASDDPPQKGERWQRYGRESFGCVTLRYACRQSIAQRAALVFT